MTANMVLVHGTGVRSASWTPHLDDLKAEAARRRIDVRPCVWGDDFGASLAALSPPVVEGAVR